MSAGPDVSRLTPDDAVAALRSFPRRFRAVLAWPEDEPRPEWFDAVAAEVAAAGRELAERSSAVGRALVATAPSAAPVEPAGPRSAEAALDLLALEAGALADRAEGIRAHDWLAAPAALDLLREAVRATAVHLQRAEQERNRAV